MAEKTIKILQFWYTTEVPVPGGTAMAERIATRGQTVDITEDYDLNRGEAEDAFMSDAELEAFRNEGTPYDRHVAEEPSDAAPFDWASASPDDMADYMEEHSMTVNDVLEVGHAHPDRVNDLLEAESIVTEDSPRKGVTEGLERIAAQASESE
jgi:hypothetical protein